MSCSAAASGTQKTPAIRPCQKFQGHSDWVRGVIHLPGGQRIMTCSSDGSLRVWNSKTGEQIRDAWQDGKNGVLAIALSLDGKNVICGCKDGAVKLWVIDTGKIIAKWTGHTKYVTSVCWNRDCRRVVSASGDGTARVWDVESGHALLAIETGLSEVQTVIYSSDMTMIGTGGVDGAENGLIKIWNAKTGKLVTNLEEHTQNVYCLAWTADGSTLISGSLDHSIVTWNTTTWQQIHVLKGHTDIVLGIAISPNRPILASVSWDNTAQLWNLENGLPIGSPLQHPDNVQCLAFSTDGKLLATGCWDNNAYSWDISEILKEAGLLNPNHGDKPLIDADATQRPGIRRKDVYRVPPNFFDDSPHHPDSSRRPIPLSSAHQHDVPVNPSPRRHPLLGRISLLFLRNHNNKHDTLPRPRFLQSVRNIFFHSPRGQHDQGIQLQEPSLTVVDVPCTKGKRRNISAAEIRFKKEKAKKAKKASTGNSRPPQSSVALPSGEGADAQPSSEPHADVSASSTTPVIAGTSAVISTSLPDAVISRAGRWTRFWLFVGCVSAQYTDD